MNYLHNSPAIELKKTPLDIVFSRRMPSVAILMATLVALTSAVEAPAIAASISPAQNHQGRTLTFEDRVAYQYAIEEVYWRHRIWPKENAKPKPPLDEVMSAAQIEKKVQDYLRDSQLLEDQWQQPITTEQLQAEMQRMASYSRQPEVLREIFDALGSNAFVIAECLARPILTERMLAGRKGGSSAPMSESGRRLAVESLDLDGKSKREGIKTSRASNVVAVPRGAADRSESMSIRKPALDNAAYTLPEIFVPTDCTDDSWMPTKAPSDPRGGYSAVWTGSEMIIWGGEGDSYLGYLNTGARYNPSTDSWTATATSNAPEARVAHNAIWTGSEMIVWGGFFFDGDQEHYLSTGGKYDPGTDSWTSTRITNAPVGRSYSSAIWTGSEMIVWGGQIGGGDYFNTGGKYDPISDSWTATSVMNAPIGRDGHTVVWTGSEMIVWGGYNTSLGHMDTGGRYDPSSDSWTATNTSGAPEGRTWHTAVWTGNEMIIWGGESPNYSNIGGRYDPSSDSWTATSSTNAPIGRYFHTAIWTGTMMIVWGGDDKNGLALNTGGRYDPNTDSWTTTNSTQAPVARDSQTALWTGSQMIVWGGYNGDSYLNSGARYNPTDDSWTAIGITDAPDVREQHTAIWTGSEMIVWGGTYGSSLNTGGRYNPSTDSWRATSRTNAPFARYAHKAVWTGSEMIVWGGFEDTNYFNSGGRYNPSTDTWTATSTTNAPIGRSAHSSFWTGNEMIVWGGYNNGSVLNTGGRYNPSSDSWTATNSANAPAARYRNGAVWTGREMIIWGGYNLSGYLDTGGRYNPNTDSWTTTSTGNAPAERYLHTAIWTGNQMLVWGGGGYNTDLNSGGRYCVQPSTPILQRSVSRKVHGNAGPFDVTLPLSGTPGIECRSGGATNDYIIAVTFLADVLVSGNPQAVASSGIGTVGTAGVSNGGTVTISGNVVTIPLTSVTNAQTINVTLNGVNGSTNVVIPMKLLLGDVNGNGSVNASDVAQAKLRVGQAVGASNFRSDVNANGSINASDVSIVKGKVGTGLP